MVVIGASTHFADSRRDDLAELAMSGWLNTKKMQTRLEPAVTHPSTNPGRRGVTTSIENNALTLCQTTEPVYMYFGAPCRLATRTAVLLGDE